MRLLVSVALLMTSLLIVATPATAATTLISGRYEMKAVVVAEHNLGDRSEGTRYTRSVRIRRVTSGRCAWRMRIETVDGDFDRLRLCRSGRSYTARRTISRSCLNDTPGRSSGSAVFRFRVTRAVVRDGRRHAARLSGTYDGRYSGCGEPGVSTERWKYSARRTDLPPPPTRPEAAFSFEPSSPAVTGARNTVFFTDESGDSGDDGRVVKWTWDFGDPASGAANSATAEDPSHAYAQAGNYRVTLTVTDDRGLTDSVSDVVYVAP